MFAAPPGGACPRRLAANILRGDGGWLRLYTRRVTPTTPRAVIYGRVSADRVNGRSVDSQLDVGRRWAEHEGAQVVGLYRDDGISASRYANGKVRHGWVEVVALIESRAVDVLWVWELSRASRDRRVFAALIEACVDMHVRIVVDERSYDPTDPDDAHALDTMAATAVLESGRTRKRVLRAVKDRAAQGSPHGSITYGYRSEYDPSTGRLLRRVPDPDSSMIVQEIVRRVLAGESIYSVARNLNERGVPAPKGGQWLGANLQRLICNPTYIGRRVYRGEVQPGVETKWPAILAEAEHYQLLAMFDDPARRKYRQDTRVRHLGTGLFRCGREGCGGYMRTLTKQQYGRPNSYACRACHKVSRTQNLVDDLVEEVMWRRLAMPDVLALLSEPDDADAKEAQVEVARLTAQLNDVRARVDAGALGLDDLEYFRARWEPQLRRAEERARPKSVPPLLFEVAGPDAEIRWKALPVTAKRTLVAALLDVVIMPAGRGGRFDPADIVMTWKGPLGERN